MDRRLQPGKFYGRIIRSAAAGGVRLTETAYPAGAHLPTHSHECAYCVLVLQGSYTEMIGGRRRALERQTVVFRPPGEVHSDCFRHGVVQSLIVELGQGLWSRVHDHGARLDRPTESQDPALTGLALRLYQEFDVLDRASPLAAEGLTLELLASLVRKQAAPGANQPPPWLRRVEEMLRAHFVTPPSLAAIGDAVDVHPVHLSRAFRRYCGASLGDYVRRLKTEAACRLLRTSHCPLAEVALQSGFHDQSHFTRVFKRFTGLTPGQFRAAWKR